MQTEKKNKKGLKIISIFIIVIFLIYLDGRYLNTKGFKVQEIPVYNINLPEAYNGFKIVQFSDLHYGRTIEEIDLKKIIEEINLLNADIVIYTGDLFDSPTQAQNNQELLTNYLNNINAKIAKIAIIGDYDQNYLEEYQNILASSNFILLDNQAQLIYNKTNIPLNFIGLSDPTNANNLINLDYFNIFLIHEPDLVTSINNASLILAGHSLGGQINLPFVGGIKKINGAKTYIRGHYLVNNQDLYINNGLGTQDFSFRFLNKPTITLYRLYTKEA